MNAEVVNDRAKLTMHRLIARELAVRTELVEMAKAANAGRSGDFVDEWQKILDLPVPDIRRMLTERSQRMTRLRLSSPFTTLVDLADEGLRRRIWRGAKRSVTRRA